MLWTKHRKASSPSLPTGRRFPGTMSDFQYSSAPSCTTFTSGPTSPLSEFTESSGWSSRWGDRLIFLWQISYSVTETEWVTRLGTPLCFSLTTRKMFLRQVLCFQVTEETDFIVFHMAGMNITSKKINEKLKIRRWSSALRRLESKSLQFAEYWSIHRESRVRVV